MKIAQIVSTAPPHIGGMGAVCFNEASELAKRGHAVTVFTLNHGGNYSGDAALPFNVVRLKTFLKAGDAGWVPALAFKLKDFDVVHVHYPFYGALEWVLLAHWLYGVPYVTTYHMDADVNGWKSFVQRLYDFKYGFGLHFFKNATRIITVDAEHYQQTQFGSLFKGSTEEIVNGVDSDLFSMQKITATEAGLPELEGKKVILFVGNLIPFKRLDLAIQALPHLPNYVMLLVVGGGYNENEYKKLAADLGVANRTVFYGRTDDQKVLAKLYSLATCLVVASDRAESFSLVALEALAAGVPVVGSDIVGVRARIKNGVDGFLFKPGSVQSLVDALNTILAKPETERRAMGERGREKVCRENSWQQHVNKLQKVYLDAARKK